jgi:hypothetical protein
MDPSQTQMLMYVLLAVGIFLLIAPQQYQAYVPLKFDTSTRQIIGCVALLGAYYYYNGEKFF